MVTIDVPTCVALGSAVALKHQALLPARTDALRLRALVVCAFGFAPLGQLFDLYFHDWQWQYFLTPVEPAYSMLFIMAMLGGGLLGFELTKAALAAGNKRNALLVALVPLVFTALYSAVFFRRVLWVGSYAEWSAGTATLMPMHGSFMMLLGSTGAYLGFAIWRWVLRPPPAPAER
jgi:hypothetical protein